MNAKEEMRQKLLTAAAPQQCHEHGRRKDFFQRRASKRYSQNFFQGGAKSGEIWFLPLEIEKTTFFC